MGVFEAVPYLTIYCRPGCGVDPPPPRTQFFGTAAAAEAAGYRACPDCRPYRFSHVSGWSGHELVCRAVRLIIYGIQDYRTEDELAARLGVTGRHLRRVFNSELGVTPGALARSGRAHFARSLLDETDLSVTDIAFATGFGSVRQFNRSFQAVFSATPSRVRARRGAPNRNAADGGLTLRLYFDGPLDWRWLCSVLAARAIPGVERVAGDTYRRTFTDEGHPGVLELGPGGPDHLILRAHLPRWPRLIHFVSRARQIAGLNCDLAEPSAALGADPVIGPWIRGSPGIRVPGCWDPFETGVMTLLSERLGPRAAASAAASLAERFGRFVPGLAPLGLTHAFPAPQVLAGVTRADLADAGLTGPCAAPVRAFAAAVAADQIRLDGSRSLADLVEAVAGCEGWSDASAHELAWRMGEPDACPDPGMADSAAGAAWRPWRALAVAHVRAAAAAERVAV